MDCSLDMKSGSQRNKAEEKAERAELHPSPLWYKCLMRN